MTIDCRLKANCPTGTSVDTIALAAKYDSRVPRYTSYPTAPHFHAEVDEYAYRAWLGAIDATRPISLYLHIPFCNQLCWYCGCNTSITQRREPISDYVDMLVREIELVAEAIGRRVPAAAVHFGGGTPNSLQPEDLDRIFAALHHAFALEPDAEISIEIDPRGLTAEWVEAAARNGLKRASLGVQDTNLAVQQTINRVQPWHDTVRAVDLLRNAGVRSINLDLMFGLPLQTTKTISDTLQQVFEVMPDRIAMFGYAHVPWMKTSQKLLPEESLPGTTERLEQQSLAEDILTAAGYTGIGLDHFARQDDALAKAFQLGQLHRNFQGYTTDGADTLIGFGASSIGRSVGGYVQNHAKTNHWRDAIRAGCLPVARGMALTADDRLRGALIEQLMCAFCVDLNDFNSPDNASGGFAEELLRLASYQADGLVIQNGLKLTVTKRGRPFIRSICAVFDRYLDPLIQRHSRGI